MKYATSLVWNLPIRVVCLNYKTIKDLSKKIEETYNEVLGEEEMDEGFYIGIIEQLSMGKKYHGSEVKNYGTKLENNLTNGFHRSEVRKITVSFNIKTAI